MRPAHRWRRALGLGLLLAHPVWPAEPAVVPSFAAGGKLGAESGFTLELSRPLSAEEGRLAVFVGVADWTGAMTAEGLSRWNSSTGAPRLPLGLTEVVVYRVSPAGEWSELGRFPVQVTSGRTFEKALVQPSLTVNLNAQLREAHRPATNAPPRSRYQDVEGQLALKTEHARPGLGLASEAKLAGVSHRPQALRFGTLAESAPRLDLAGYSLDLAAPRVRLHVGDLKHGTQRLLLGDFGARGASLRLDLGGGLDLTAAGLSGSQLVGWKNPLGLDTSEHRLASASLGFELDRSRPGGLRLELSALDGSRLPIASYSQGVVNDAESSRGYAVRLAGSDRGGRLRVEAGYASSRFSNPPDPLLAQGAPLTALRAETRSASYLQSALQVLQGLELTPTKKLALSVGYEQERVAPQFRSVGAPQLQADLLSRRASAQLSLAEISLQASHQRLEDNLDDVPSILKTFTRRTAAGLNLPVASLLPGESSFWRPVASYAFDQVHQFGGALPQNSDFSATHVPDQVSTSHSGGLQWQGQRFGLGYAFTRAFQDNRQTGRETADLASATHGLSASYSRDSGLELAFEVARERSEARQSGEHSGLRRAGLSLTGGLGRGLGVQAMASHTWDDAPPGTRGARRWEADLSASWTGKLRGPDKQPQLKLWLRWATQRARDQGLSLQVAQRTEAWQLFSGLSLTAF